jgi:hypothetical protein
MNGNIQVEMHGDHAIIRGVNCSCGCGEYAGQLYKGVPIPDVNPLVHYRTYLKKLLEGEDKRMRENGR